MKKIFFNDKYSLTQAVLEGHKTMLRRIVPIDTYNMTDWKEVEEGNYMAVSDGDGHYYDIRRCGNYGIGDVVAIAQSYNNIHNEYSNEYSNTGNLFTEMKATLFRLLSDKKGWNNKMFVEAKFMPHHIKIINIKVERLQDISDEDCLKEGVYMRTEQHLRQEFEPEYTFGEGKYHAQNSITAFAALIDKVSGKGTWNSNPWCFCYEFELID